MDIVIIGKGAVGSAFNRALLLAADRRDGVSDVGREGFSVVSVGRGDVIPDADFYIVAVPDREIVAIAERLPKVAIVVHTAGGVGCQVSGVNEGQGSDCGVIYPLQTFTRGREADMRQVPLLVEWTSERAREAIMEVAAMVSERVIYVDSDVRLRVHLAAVFVNNFVNHMIAIGQSLAPDALLLRPLIEETISKAIAVTDARTVQTGPAIRGDRETMQRHLALLSGVNREVYEVISKSIVMSYEL